MANESNTKEIRKSLLILKSNPMALQAAEIFLGSRGWEVYSAINLQETIKIVLTKNPEYLLICANHHQKKVKSLPKILSQAVQIKVILYIDIASAININLMNQMGFSNHILPPVSGPAIERAVFKFEKEEIQKQSDKKKNAKESMGTYSVSRDETNPELELKINQFLRNLEEEDDSPPTTDQDDTPETFAEYEARKLREREARMLEEAKSTGGPTLNPKNPNSDSSKLLIPNSQISIKQSDSIMVKGAQLALDSAAKHNLHNARIEKLEKSQNCICIIVDSTRFSGYLIAALGKNRRFDDEFVNNIQTKLYDFLKTQGEKLDDDAALEIKIKTVEFEDWALEQAQFLKKSVHNGDEVAMAFFPTQKTAPEVEQSVREDMLQINIEDLHSDVQVPFDVYVYLPANNKYILYTPKGGTFLSAQKDRLKGKGITHMHMKKDEISSAKKYTAETYLNNKVEEFNQGKEANDKKKSG